MPNKPPERVPPTDAPADAVERVAGRRSLAPQPGDILVKREPAGRPGTVGGWRYGLQVEGQQETRYFSRYDAAAAEGEQLAAHRKVRLFYNEDGTSVLLMDYRGEAGIKLT